MAFFLLQTLQNILVQSSGLKNIPEKRLTQIYRPIISVLVSFSVLQSTPIIPLSHASDSMTNIARASETVDFLLDNLENKENKEADLKRLFDRVDFIIKQFSLRERLQLALAEAPQEYRYRYAMKR
jgi:hypothetical protein